MSKKFAFKLSAVDLIRKLRHRYDHPLDYLDNFVSRLYQEGEEIDLSLTDTEIKVESPASIDELFLEELEQNSILTVAAVIPPVSEYTSVELRSGEKVIEIGEDRKVKVEKAENHFSGTQIIINRERNGQSEKDRILELYDHSDLKVKVDGEKLKSSENHNFSFNRDGFKGTLTYNPFHEGGLHFFQNGRYVSTESLVPGLELHLYEHGFQPTITKSRMITRGRGKKEHQKLEENIPEILLSYLQSEAVVSLRQKSERSYQTILRAILPEFHQDEKLRAYVKENISLAEREEGLVKLLEKEEEKELKGPSKWLVGSAVAFPLATLAAGIILNYQVATGNKEVNNSLPNKPTVTKIATEGKNENSRLNFVPGGSFQTRESLIMTLNSPPKNGKGGYLRTNTANSLTCNYHYFPWANEEPLDQLIVTGCDVRVPVEIIQELNNPGLIEKISRDAGVTSTFDAKLKAVQNYIQRNFEYDSLDPKLISQDSTLLEAMLAEKKAVCREGNSYAAMLLHELGVKEGVRSASGYFNGIGHVWLEVNRGTRNDPSWEIYDFTPGKMNPNVLAGLDKNISSDQIRRGLEGTAQELWRNPTGTIVKGGEAEIKMLFENPKLYFGTAGGQIVGFSLLALLAAGLYLGGVKASATVRDKFSREKSIENTSQFGSYERSCLQLRDILGLENVEPTNENDFIYERRILSVPKQYLDQHTISKIALAAVPHLGLSDNKQLKLYSSIVDVTGKN
ncbi:transglutaminase domain-containing protein [Candidatus Woesearchaeota archaeon]|mgnify:FL=1|jgi:hypothetical protein|nr:transglutaminase domain-containing protein [Candidatus Woesearchaeota archaeon]